MHLYNKTGRVYKQYGNDGLPSNKKQKPIKEMLVIDRAKDDDGTNIVNDGKIETDERESG